MSLKDDFPWLEGVGGIFEPLATMGTAIAGEIPAGFYGLYETARTGDPMAGAQAVQDLQEQYTYMPRTEAGQTGLQRVGEGLEAVMDWPGLIPTMSANDAVAQFRDQAGRLGAGPAALLEGVLAAGPPIPAKAGALARVVDDLPMDQASRMKRAESLGFDTSKTYYRGKAYDEGSVTGDWFADNPEYAGRYAYKASGGTPMPAAMQRDDMAPNITPAYIKQPYSLSEDVAGRADFEDWLSRKKPFLAENFYADPDAPRTWLRSVIGPRGELSYLNVDDYLAYLDDIGVDWPDTMLIDEANEQVSARVFASDAVRSIYDPYETPSRIPVADNGSLGRISD